MKKLEFKQLFTFSLTLTGIYESMHTFGRLIFGDKKVLFGILLFKLDNSNNKLLCIDTIILCRIQNLNCKFSHFKTISL